MKTLFFLSFMLMAWILLISCQEKEHMNSENDATEENVAAYDSVLATQLNADDYGMKKYVMAFLKPGPNRNQDSLEAAQLQRAHMDNIFRLAEEGKLVLAGPFMDQGPYRGMYVFNVTSLEEAKALTETDPAIQAGRLEMELHPWYGPATLQMINDWHKKVQKNKI